MIAEKHPTASKPDYHRVKVLATVLASLCILTVALTLGLGHLYMMAIAVAMVPLVSYAVGKRMLTGLSVQRDIVDVAWEGQPVSVNLTVRNDSPLPRYFLQAQETLPDGAQFSEGNGVIPLAIPPHGSQQAHYQVVFGRRGRHRLGPLWFHSTDPLGMFYFTYRLPEQAEILVLPSPLPPPFLQTLQGAVHTPAGTNTAPVRGDSVEFLGIREYVPGDPLRRVDWKHSARYGELFVREFERFTQTEVCVLLDCSSHLQQVPQSFETMVKAASGVLHLAYSSGLPFRLSIGIPDVDNQPAQCSTDQLYRCLYALAEVQPRPDYSWRDVLAKAVGEAPQGAILACITATADHRLLPLFQACERRQLQVHAFLPNVPALDRSPSRVADALHDGEFMRLLAAHRVNVVALHPGGEA